MIVKCPLGLGVNPMLCSSGVCDLCVFSREFVKDTKPLGADFEKVWDDNVADLYEN